MYMYFPVLLMKLRVICMLGKRSAIELHPRLERAF
jgi:hypothetical protein